MNKVPAHRGRRNTPETELKPDDPEAADRRQGCKSRQPGHGFKLFSDKIETPGDGLIIFRGLQDHTAESIKLLVWDKVFGFGSTEALAGFAATTANLVVSFYFAKRGFENVARIIKR